MDLSETVMIRIRQSSIAYHLSSTIVTDGIKEKDRRQMNSVLLSVSHVKENLHHLSRHLWSEVLEDWPFYTEKEKEAVKR